MSHVVGKFFFLFFNDIKYWLMYFYDRLHDFAFLIVPTYPQLGRLSFRSDGLGIKLGSMRRKILIDTWLIPDR